jgi:hypothetical protein
MLPLLMFNWNVSGMKLLKKSATRMTPTRSARPGPTMGKGRLDETVPWEGIVIMSNEFKLPSNWVRGAS